jgi:hypothetical protein
MFFAPGSGGLPSLPLRSMPLSWRRCVSGSPLYALTILPLSVHQVNTDCVILAESSAGFFDRQL